MASAGDAMLLEIYEETLRENGIRGVLKRLNEQGAHRYTGIYYKVGDRLKNLYIYDRENPEFAPFPDIPATSSYCSLVIRTCVAFSSESTLQDPRLADHPAREQVQSYCGAPLKRSNGEVFGTLCFFDFVPRRPVEGQTKMLDMVAGLLGSPLDKLTS
jgi:GAF domain-containing protein